MNAVTGSRRARVVRRLWLAALVFLVAGATPGAAAGQVRPDTVPRDTVPGDTVVVPIPPVEVENDTLPADSLLRTRPDSLRTAANFPLFPDPFPEGWAFARWEWTRDELLRYRGLSLLELLARVPGVVVTRAGGFGRPAGLSALGTGGARLRVFLDGFEVDPLLTGNYDLQHIGLVDLEAVRVHRSLTETRVELSTLRLPDARPYSEVEVGTGTPDTKLLRAILARPIGERNVVTGAYDLVTTSGFGIREPYQFGGGRLSWSHALTPATGFRVDLFQSGVERESEIFPLNGSRRELILRGRSEVLPGLVVDGLAARSWWLPDDPQSGTAAGGQLAAVDTLALDLSSTQGMLRAGYRLPFGYMEAAARVRGGEERVPAPDSDLSARALLRPLPWVGVEAEARRSALDGEGALETRATARVGPFAGLAAFASVSWGERFAGLVRDTVLELEVEVEDTVTGVPQLRTRRVFRPAFSAIRADAGGLRLGGEWSGRGGTIGAALLTQEPTRVVPFGFVFDRAVVPLAAERATGLEAYVSAPLPLTGGALRVDGWYQRWAEQGLRPYLPAEQAQLALEYHRLLFDGEFEPTLRLEAVYRGASIVPNTEGTFFGGVTEPYTLANFFMQLRIQDVRAFLVFENLLNNRVAADLLGRPQPGPRLLYGVRWFFRD